MATPTVSWDETSPAGSQDVNLGDNRIRELKTQLREVITIDHEMDSSGQDTDWGYHKAIHLVEQANLGTGASGICLVGAQTSAYADGKPELAFTDEDDNDVELTRNGVLGVEPGIIQMWGGSEGTIPTGWILCDGSQYAKSGGGYDDLYAAIGIVHGESGVNFLVPDLRETFVMASKAGGSYPAGASGGDIAAITTGHTHTSAAHTHTLTHTHQVTGTTGLPSATTTRLTGGVDVADGTHTHNMDFASGASSSPWVGDTAVGTDVGNIVIPYYCIVYMIKK